LPPAADPEHLEDERMSQPESSEAGKTRRPGAPLWPALPLGAAAGAFAAVAVGLASPELYTDWGGFAGFLVVIPLAAVVAAALVAVPLAAIRRIAWWAVPLALVTAIVAGELVFQATQGTAFARWSAARHWSAVERRAAAERETAQRDVCRRLLAEPPVPPPPAPRSAASAPIAPAERVAQGSSLTLFTRERCTELLGR
jgi:hypothetical protein